MTAIVDRAARTWMRVHVQRLRNRVAYSAYVEEFAQLRIPLVFPPPEAARTWSRATKSGQPTRLR